MVSGNLYFNFFCNRINLQPSIYHFHFDISIVLRCYRKVICTQIHIISSCIGSFCFCLVSLFQLYTYIFRCITCEACYRLFCSVICLRLMVSCNRYSQLIRNRSNFQLTRRCRNCIVCSHIFLSGINFHIIRCRDRSLVIADRCAGCLRHDIMCMTVKETGCINACQRLQSAGINPFTRFSGKGYFPRCDGYGSVCRFCSPCRIVCHPYINGRRCVRHICIINGICTPRSVLRGSILYRKAVFFTDRIRHCHSDRMPCTVIYADVIRHRNCEVPLYTEINIIVFCISRYCQFFPLKVIQLISIRNIVCRHING